MGKFCAEKVKHEKVQVREEQKRNEAGIGRNPRRDEKVALYGCSVAKVLYC